MVNSSLAWLGICKPTSALAGMMSAMDDHTLEQLAYILTGISPRTNIKDLMVNTRGQLTFGVDYSNHVALEGWGCGVVAVQVFLLIAKEKGIASSH